MTIYDDGSMVYLPGGDGGPEGWSTPRSRTARRWTILVLIVVTALAVIALALWLPAAVADPSGGCGGG